MRVLDIKTGIVHDAIDGIKAFDQLQWVDYIRSENWNQGKLGSVLHESHKEDILNALHPPYFESAEEYEMMIIRAFDERVEITEPSTRSIALIIIGNTLFTFREEDDETLSKAFASISARRQNLPSSILSLVYELLDEIIDRFLDLREPLSKQVGEWQRRLLDPNDPFSDWPIILQAKSSLGRLNTNLEVQMEIIASWQEQSRYELDSEQVIRFNDLHEHLARMKRFSNSVRKDLDSLTQVYFATSGQQTNSIVQFLAVISAIFLPLNLIAGLFGMNFESIPLLQSPWGPYIVAILMLVLTIVLLWWFKRRKWF